MAKKVRGNVDWTQLKSASRQGDGDKGAAVSVDSETLTPGHALIVGTDGGVADAGSSARVTGMVSVVGVTIDGGGAVPTSGVKGWIRVPWSGTIVGWDVDNTDVPGVLAVDISKCSSAAPPSPPTVPDPVADKISASAPISMNSARSASGGADEVSTWSKAVSQWDVIQFSLVTVQALKRATVQLYIARD